MARCRSSAAAKSSAPYLSCNTVRAMAHHLHDALDGSNCRFSPDAVAHVFHPPPPTPSRHPPTPTPQPPTLPAAPELASPPDPGAAYMHAPTRGREEGGGGGGRESIPAFCFRLIDRYQSASARKWCFWGIHKPLSPLSLARSRALSFTPLSHSLSHSRSLLLDLSLSLYPLPLPPVPLPSPPPSCPYLSSSPLPTSRPPPLPTSFSFQGDVVYTNALLLDDFMLNKHPFIRHPYVRMCC